MVKPLDHCLIHNPFQLRQWHEHARLIRRADHFHDFFARQIAEHRSLEALDRNAEGALDHLQRGHVAMHSELQERAQRRQAGITATHAVVPLAFQMIKEGHDQIRRNLGQSDRRRRPAKARLGKAQEEHEGVPVRGDRLRT